MRSIYQYVHQIYQSINYGMCLLYVDDMYAIEMCSNEVIYSLDIFRPLDPA